MPDDRLRGFRSDVAIMGDLPPTRLDIRVMNVIDAGLLSSFEIGSLVGKSRETGLEVDNPFMRVSSLDRGGCDVGLIAIVHLFHFRREPVKRANE